ncbi:hypothetical protein J4G43_030330 [Bradyrhizobium barranii subsp. barranii]|uniref:Uncharacterized protein n=1 Tax=Bradyrhizobium barranii subsp. barranii TaxID=2823807 RepID=A0A939MCR1_9BRAD|nr:hypothetical protein [Bradyrhizobium barranii]UEM09038.1 hypothetical protein J4G43_030330 [Bradyrhizobium barranii subsp. barranii]
MRPLSQTLTDLIGFTEEVITRPARHHGLAADTRYPLLAQEIRDADKRPAEGVRCTHSGVAIVACLDAFFASDMDPTSRWLGAIGALLPLLRGEAWQQLKSEKEAAGEAYRR